MDMHAVILAPILQNTTLRTERCHFDIDIASMSKKNQNFKILKKSSNLEFYEDSEYVFKF